MLNTEHFILLAGDPSKWDAETLTVHGKGDDALCNVQMSQSNRGRRSATLWQNVFGWCVGYASNLQNRAVIRGGRQEPNMTLEQAVQAGVDWAKQDPANREFFAFKKDVKGLTIQVTPDISITVS